MKSITRVMRVLAIAVMVGTVFVANSEAAVISISPATQNANVGANVNVDILVSLGLGEVVGGVSLFLGFNPAILSGVSYTVDPDAKMGVAACEAASPGACEFSGGFSGGAGSPLDLFFLADFNLNGAQLGALQGGGFRLATVSFTATAAGVSALTLSVAQPGGAFLSDANGNVLPANAVNGSVCVGPACFPSQVPEPGTLGLMGVGLVLAARSIRRRQR